MNHVSLTGPEGYRSEVHEERRKKEGRIKKITYYQLPITKLINV
jgi:hypothetical protein